MTFAAPDIDCGDCLAASVGLHHTYRAACRVCTARGVGRGPGFAESAKLGWLTPRYQVELAKLGLTHAAVKAARAVDFEATGQVSTLTNADATKEKP